MYEIIAELQKLVDTLTPEQRQKLFDAIRCKVVRSSGISGIGGLIGRKLPMTQK